VLSRFAAFLAFLGVAALMAFPVGRAGATGRVDPLAAAAPNANAKVLALALGALSCHQKRAGDAPEILGVIDYSMPSSDPRFWVFDLRTEALLFEERVAHGRNSGANYAERFSNQDGSLMSSLGAFETAGTYIGHNGYSLRLKGLEPGFNDHAEERAIVIHGARYVSDESVLQQGRIGRSFGCPAVRPAVAPKLIDTLRDHAFLFAYYPDPDWLRRSNLLGPCD
jgi:hypothetical protein